MAIRNAIVGLVSASFVATLLACASKDAAPSSDPVKRGEQLVAMGAATIATRR